VATIADPHMPHEAEVVERVQESPQVFTLRLRLAGAGVHERYAFQPGQFNMLYCHGLGEVPISIVSDPEDESLLDHTIRPLGRVTHGLARLQAGDRLGVRGPYGRGWPVSDCDGGDVVLVTGGLGCAPVMSVINYVLKRRGRFARLVIMQGVKHSDDLIWREQYERWAAMPETQVLLAADVGDSRWPWDVGPVTTLFDRATFDRDNSMVMMCGPEVMMRVASKDLIARGVPAGAIWLSLERNMKCAMGQCGHCQLGGDFVCRDGPVFPYPQIAPLFGEKGF